MITRFVAVFVALAFFGVAPSNGQGASDWQKRAVAKYPALGVAESAFHKAFMVLYEKVKIEQPELLLKPDWPLVFADIVAGASEKMIEGRDGNADRKAFDTLYFGDSEKLTETKLAQSRKLIAEKAKTGAGIEKTVYSLVVGERKYALQTAFDEGKLYKIAFTQTFCDEDRYRKFFPATALEWGLVSVFSGNYDVQIKESWLVLREIAIARFGQPTVAIGYPNLNMLEHGLVIYSDKWELGKRKVSLGAVEYHEARGAFLSIADAQTENKLEAIDAAKRKLEVNKAAGGF